MVYIIIAVQIMDPKATSVTGRYYQDVILKKSFRNIIINDAPCQDLGMILLHHIHMSL